MRLSFSIQLLGGSTGDWINHAYVAVDDIESAKSDAAARNGFCHSLLPIVGANPL